MIIRLSGPDEMLATDDRDYYRGVNALSACREGIIDKDVYLQLMEAIRESLTRVGIEDLNLRGNHLLLSLDRSGGLLMGDDGLPEARICNFELLRRVSDASQTRSNG